MKLIFQTNKKVKKKSNNSKKISEGFFGRVRTRCEREKIKTMKLEMSDVY